MNVHIFNRNISLSKTDKTHMRSRVLFRLSKFQDSIQAVVLHIDDVNGPKGGVDKTCVLNLQADGMQDVIITGKSANIAEVVDKCILRAKSAFIRQRKKKQRYDKTARSNVLHNRADAYSNTNSVNTDPIETAPTKRDLNYAK